MAGITVEFLFRPGLRQDFFSNVQLVGSWDGQGRKSDSWSSTAMAGETDANGCPRFRASVRFDDSGVGSLFRWGIQLDGPGYRDRWGVVAEVNSRDSADRTRSFTLRPGGQTEAYDLTYCRSLGTNKYLTQGAAKPGLRVAVWAPNAKSVTFVLADPAHGYVADDGSGAVQTIAMAREADVGGVPSGIWSVDPGTAPALDDFEQLVGTPYLFRIERDDRSVKYRTDLYSRLQVGRGDFDPNGAAYHGAPDRLDGTKACSVVKDPDIVIDGQGRQVPAETFWKDEFGARALPARVEDLVIYELHVGALGFGKPEVGTLEDAIAFIDHLAELGVNAVELLPIAEFQGENNWGYSTSHFCAIEDSAGGVDRLKQFVRACHRRGIAVILDVCYNHYDGDAERAEWEYDSTDPTRNVYYWYEGRPGDYPHPDGGYIDNVSSGWAPRFHEEMVRQLFISSAAAFVAECHIDGFRLDQTTSIHAYPALHADGRHADNAATFGIKFLRQWTRTMRLLKPNIFLMAEDYSGWSAVTESSLDGDGLGFDAAWYGEFHHHLVEYQDSPAFAQLVKTAGYGDDRPLSMDFFAGALRESADRKVVYNESHDDCGNREHSARTIYLAVNAAPLVGETRRWGEARVRFAAVMALLSAGTPMFFMGEEVGAEKPYRFNDFMQNREDILGLTAGVGEALFGYYKDLIALSEGSPAIRSRNIEVLASDNPGRVIAFRRWSGNQEMLVVASLHEEAYLDGYTVRSDRLGGDGTGWTEIFNSDAAEYGGWNVGNAGATLRAAGGALTAIIPASGCIVLKRG